MNLAEIIKHGSTPMLTKVPESIYRIKLDSKLILSCEAEGNPKPTVKWIRYGRTFSFNSTITIEKATPENDGFYECVARNRNGKASKEVRIIIVGSISPDSNLNDHRDLLENIIEASKYSKKIELGDLLTLNTTDVLKFFDLTRLLIAYSDNRTQFDAVIFKTSNHSLTATQATVMGNYTGCVGGARFEAYDCSHEHEQSGYYSITGICNNKKHPEWGASVSPFLRLLPPNYEDGLVKPIGWFDNDWWTNGSTISNFRQRPNSRKVTQELLSSKDITNDERHNHLLMQFGQFLDHDLTFAALSDNRNLLEGDITDCERTCQNVEPCYSILQTDVSNKCIEFKRSAEYCGSGYTSVVFGQLIQREQVNLITSFIDGSQIYGNTLEVSNYLRHPSIQNNSLLNSTIIANRTYLPYNNNQLLLSMDCQPEPESYQECFLAGDHRANEQLGLLVFHNLWLRNHNLLARKLQILRPDWSNEKIFNEARKIVAAQLQIITYRDWLPLIVGSKGMRMLGVYNGYNETVNPSISNVFATAAMRFGHTLVNKNLIRKLANFHRNKKPKNDPLDKETKIHRAFFKPDLLSKTNVLDSVLLGLAMTPLKKALPEQAITDELTERLFKLSRYTPLDLASINIQRGRDHALPDYNQWRKFCGLKMANNFDDDLKYEIKNRNIREKLKKLYGHPNNVDLYVAGIMENSDHDAMVGPTFRCLIVDQFRRLRDGDRFFYLNRGVFTDEQLKQLENTTTLSALICQNSDNIKTFLKESFQLPNNKHSWIRCDQFQKLIYLNGNNCLFNMEHLICFNILRNKNYYIKNFVCFPVTTNLFVSLS
nr:LOW QUALITY PROTEIN: peroxidasin-like [Dermatophagoides farinae]